MSTTWATLNESAAYSRCSKVTLSREIRAGRLRAYKLAGRREWRLKISDLDAWLSGGHGDEPAQQVFLRAEQGQGVTR